MRTVSEQPLDTLIDDLRRVALDRRWAFYIRDARTEKDVIVCLHPYPTSSIGGSPEYFRLNYNPKTGLYSRSPSALSLPV